VKSAHEKNTAAILPAAIGSIVCFMNAIARFFPMTVASMTRYLAII
jgi:hypothetical protein